MPENKYHITVGMDRPKTVRIGTLERGSGSTIVKDRGETLAKRGDTGFPNGTKIWAARVIDGKISKDGSPIAVTDPQYKGQIKRMKWGEEGGSLIAVRWLKGYPTLDVLYQERVLNFKIDESNENVADIYMLMFPNGDNDFDETTDQLLIEHLKGHTYNRDSVSKDPNFNSSMFYEKNFEQEQVLDSIVLDVKFEAAKVLRQAVDGVNETQRLKNLFSIVRSVTDEVPEDSKLYAYLKMIADKKPSEFLKAIADYKMKLSNTFEKLKSYEAIDLTINGSIAAGQKKKELIVSDIPAKDEGMLDYLLTNFSDPVSFDAAYNLIQISDKLK